MTNIKQSLTLLIVAMLSTACLNNNEANLNNLGSTDDFMEQEIDPDFEAPEDESEAEKKTCSGFVNTVSGALNVRTDSNTDSEICATLATKTSLSIALEGHKDGFIKITTPKCEQDWVYVSDQYVGLGSDCTFSIGEEQEPEKDVEVGQQTCNGFIDTTTSPLNIRTDSNTNSDICAKLDPRTPITISVDGHQDGFLKITTPECEQDWVYASNQFIELGSDCPFEVEEKPDTGNRTPDSLLNTFYIERRTFNLANGSAKRWDGCESGYKSIGGYNSDRTCGRAFLHEKFSDNLNEQFYKCVFNAADTAGYAETQKVFINHLGSYNDRTARNSTRKSNHAYARALDIKNFNLVDSNGNISKVSTLLRDYKGKQAVFYDEFRQCWKDSMPSSCRSGNTEYKGSVGHKSSKLGGNTLHNDHIHLSFPLCAG